MSGSKLRILARRQFEGGDAFLQFRGGSLVQLEQSLQVCIVCLRIHRGCRGRRMDWRSQEFEREGLRNSIGHLALDGDEIAGVSFISFGPQAAVVASIE